MCFCLSHIETLDIMLHTAQLLFSLPAIKHLLTVFLAPKWPPRAAKCNFYSIILQSPPLLGKKKPHKNPAYSRALGATLPTETEHGILIMSMSNKGLQVEL